MREMITVREAGHELRIQVVDARAYVAVVPVGAGPDDEPAASVSLPARRLHALLRAAWADDLYGMGGPLDPPMWPMSDPEPEEDPHHEERLRFGWRDDWPDGGGDPGDLVPFPRGGDVFDDPWWPPSRYTPPPRPRHHGQAWEPDDDAVLRHTWLHPEADAVRGEVLQGLADRLGRTVGAVMQRLYRVGCEPYHLGVATPVPADPIGSPEEPLVAT